MRALVSVSDKTGVIELCQFLKKKGVEIVSTGGTAKTLEGAGIAYTPIEKITGNPEAFGGRMKTISFQVGSALLFRRKNPQDIKEAEALGIKPIDIVVCNLYPFDEVVRKNLGTEELIENIDIGGPTMIRAAAKNYESVAVLVDPSDYAPFMERFSETTGSATEMRAALSVKAFQVIAEYDLRIASVLTSTFGKGLRYGENPHQKAVMMPFKNHGSKAGLAQAKVLQGKEISYNNWLDADPAFKLCSELKNEFKKAACVIVKHGTPCGVAIHDQLFNAFELAWNADSVSAFGGIIAFSETVDESLAQNIAGRFVEVVIAPSFSDGAKKVFAQKKNVRLLETPLKTKGAGEWCVRSINGGVLVQDEDELTDQNLKCVTKTQLKSGYEEVIRFGTISTKYLKSNCIGIFGRVEGGISVLVSGVGQPNRLECITKLVAPRAKEKKLDLKDAVLVSDAFFPFRDSIDACKSLGVKTIVQPGGSIRDEEVIQACDESGIAMVFTGNRHFRH